MSHALTASALGAIRDRGIPADLLIPMPPRARRIAITRKEPWWREAMRWSMIGLTASWVAGEVTLLLLGF